MKFLKRTIVILLSLAVVLALVFLAGRYGWKTLGFRACQGAGIETVTVGENTVEIRGFYPGSFPQGFCGYYAQEQDGTLYVGFRFSGVFGSFDTGEFDVTIPVTGQIRRVVLKTSETERELWTAEAEQEPASLGNGVYIKREGNDIQSIYLKYTGVLKVWQSADGSLPKAGEWLFTGEKIAELSGEENRSVLFTVGAKAADGTCLAENAFFYDVAQEKLYVTVSVSGVTCSTSGLPDAAAEDLLPVLTLPILDEINETVTVGTSGSSLLAVQAAVKLLDWGVNTGLGTDEIEEAAIIWLSQQGDLTDCLQKLSLVEDAYQKLLGGNARELLDVAGCADTDIFWNGDPVEPVEAIMEAAGLKE